jgi:hypothetical protein
MHTKFHVFLIIFGQEKNMGQNLSDPRNNEQPQCVISSDVLANNSMKPTKTSEISGSHSDEYVDGCLHGCCTM